MGNNLTLLSEEAFLKQMIEGDSVVRDLIRNSMGLKKSPFAIIQEINRRGLARQLLNIGDQITCTYGDMTLTWDIIGIDHDTPTDKQYKHSITLHVHDAISQMAFNASEDFYHATNDIPAGVIAFTVKEHTWVPGDVGKTFYWNSDKPLSKGSVTGFICNYTDSLSTATIGRGITGDEIHDLQTMSEKWGEYKDKYFAALEKNLNHGHPNADEIFNDCLQHSYDRFQWGTRFSEMAAQLEQPNAAEVWDAFWASVQDYVENTAPADNWYTALPPKPAFSHLGNISNIVTPNLNSLERALVGANDWSTSALRQVLNSTAAAGSVWEKQGLYDTVPAWNKSTAGFLNGLDPEFVKILGAVDKVTAQNSVCDGGESYVTADKVFLLSRTEVFGGQENGIDEGKPYEYYVQKSASGDCSMAAEDCRVKRRNGAAVNWWLRSPRSENAGLMRGVTSTGSILYYPPAFGYGVVPAVCIV